MGTLLEQLETAAAEYGPREAIGDGAMHIGPRSFSDWQNQVELTLQRLWPQLARETRLALYLNAQMHKRRMPDHWLADSPAEKPKRAPRRAAATKEVG